MMRVLIVDDHPLFRQGLRSFLEKGDISVILVGEAADGQEAVKLTAENEPDVVVMDIYMPNLNGLEATRQIRDRFPRVKVIILSSYGDNVYVAEALKLGARGFVLKDAVYEELAVALKAVIEGKLYLSPGVLEPIVNHFIETPPVSKALTAYNNLTSREQETFELLAQNQSRGEIAKTLGISIKTVDTHRFNLMKKLNLDSETDIASFAAMLRQELPE